MEANKSSKELKAVAVRDLESRGVNMGVHAAHSTISDSEVDLSKLWPALLSTNEIVVERLPKRLSSVDQVAELVKRGGKIQPLPLRLYRNNTYAGSNRAMDNSDWLKGKEPLYDDLAHANSIRTQLVKLIAAMKSQWEPIADKVLWASMEMQDLVKITAQQWRPTFWFGESPITASVVPALSPECISMIRRVVDRYVQVLKPTGLLEKSFDELVMLDTDPPDTATGSPTYVGGDVDSPKARYAILKALPDITGANPDRWIERLRALEMQLSLPPNTIDAPVVSTRQGPLRKPVKLWERGPGEFFCTHQATGMYSRTRFVYPAPFWLNFILSPAYVLLSGARKRILGLWHDPEHQEQYIKVLQSQGKYVYSIDFSGMDTAMFPHIVTKFMEILANAGIATWSMEVFRKLYGPMQILYPSYEGDVNSVTALGGTARPWCSGFKLTSEMDTLYGECVLLMALEEQMPGITEKWCAGQFVFLELGDDIMFTSPVKLDPEKVAANALRNWGAKLEIIEDAMFLKWMYPLAGAVPKLTRPLSRFIQQTFYHEDRYTGIEGGDKPDAILRLGLIARSVKLSDHPAFKEWWPHIADIVLQLGYVTRSTEEFRASVRSGKILPQPGDAEEITKYGMTHPAYLAGILERAKYEPSSAHLLQVMADIGLNVSAPSAADQRKVLLNALHSTPTQVDVDTLYNEYVSKVV